MRRDDVTSRSPGLVLLAAFAAFAAGLAAVVVVLLLGNSVL
jgi:hypothetical protein